MAEQRGTSHLPEGYILSSETDAASGIRRYEARTIIEFMMYKLESSSGVADEVTNYLESLPRLSIATVSPENSTDRECAICKNDYYQASAATTSLAFAEPPCINESPLRLPCSQIMGRKCMENWLRSTLGASTSTPSCPLCRTELAVSEAMPRAPARGDGEFSSILFQVLYFALKTYLRTDLVDVTYADFKDWATTQHSPDRRGDPAAD